MLSEADIESHATTYFEQAGKILDTAPGKLEIRRNSEWLAGMRLVDVLQLTSRMTVARMLERDTFEKRYEADVPIGLHEFLYPLMQGYDSVMIRADVELGGTDQLFNNLVGRDLQRDAGQEPQVVMILPILEGLDGVEKMSKSKGNYIGINDTPKDMFGKTMSVGDDLMWKWYALLFAKAPGEIAGLKKGHPMETKKALAHAVVVQYHGAAAADHAREDFEKQFSKRDLAEVAESLSVPAGETWIVELVEKTGKFKSRGDIRRVIQQGGVSLDGQKITDDKARVAVRSGQLLKAGKLVVVKLTVA
jgi:tyrosyl-tRNA synthetase